MRQKILLGLTILALIVFVKSTPVERDEDSFTNILYTWGEQQANNSDKITVAAVSDVEGTLVGEHEENGANWSIPNIIRHILGAD